jgi:DNA polymerase-3 subunit beta
MTATKTKAAGITLDAATLRTALADVLRAVPTKSPRPVLQNVRLGDGLLSATDLEVRIDREIDYHGDAVLLPALKLSAILKAAQGDEVTLTPKGSSIVVKCGRGSWTLPTEDVAEFPADTTGELKAVCRLPADQFRKAVHATVYACDKQSSRFALGGVLIDVTDGNPTWVATDGRRLSFVETQTDQAVDDSQTIVPDNAVAAAALLAHGDGSVQVEANRNEVRFTMDSATVTAKLLDGQFPKWRDVLKDIEGEPTVCEVAEFLSAVQSAAIVTSEQSKGVDLTWSASGVVISGRSSEYGESRVRCDIVSPGSTSNTKLDPRFVADFLKFIPGGEEPQVNVYARDAQSPVLMTCGYYKGVIMPLAE